MGRSYSAQQALIQKEVVPGTPLMDAMKALDALTFTPGWDITQQVHTSTGANAATAVEIQAEKGKIGVEGASCFNALLYVWESLFGQATTNPAVVGATKAKKHVVLPKGRGQDTIRSYTLVFGDAVQAVQIAHAVFQSFGLTINRGGLSFSTSMIGRTPKTGITFPNSGVTTVGSKVVPTRGFNVYVDDTWADLGTTQVMACYEGGVTFGDKWQPDEPINRANASFQGLIQDAAAEKTGSLRLGFDAGAVGTLNDWSAGKFKFIRFESIGPEIEVVSTDPVNYTVIADICMLITNPGDFGPAPNSPVVTLPFDFVVAVDPISGNYFQGTLINELAGV